MIESIRLGVMQGWWAGVVAWALARLIHETMNDRAEEWLDGPSLPKHHLAVFLRCTWPCLSMWAALALAALYAPGTSPGARLGFWCVTWTGAMLLERLENRLDS